MSLSLLDVDYSSVIPAKHDRALEACFEEITSNDLGDAPKSFLSPDGWRELCGSGGLLDAASDLDDAAVSDLSEDVFDKATAGQAFMSYTAFCRALAILAHLEGVPFAAIADRVVELELDAPPAQRVVAELTQLQDTSVVSALARPFSGAGALLLIFESCADGVLDRERLVLVLSDEGHLDGAREIAYQLCADAVFLCGLHCLTSSRLLSRLDVPEAAAILEEAADQAEMLDDPAEASSRVLLALSRLRQRGSFRRTARGPSAAEFQADWRTREIFEGHSDCVDRGDCAMSSTAFVRLLGASPTLSGRLSTTVFRIHFAKATGPRAAGAAGTPRIMRIRDFCLGLSRGAGDADVADAEAVLSELIGDGSGKFGVVEEGENNAAAASDSAAGAHAGNGRRRPPPGATTTHEDSVLPVGGSSGRRGGGGGGSNLTGGRNGGGNSDWDDDNDNLEAGASSQASIRRAVTTEPSSSTVRSSASFQLTPDALLLARGVQHEVNRQLDVGVKRIATLFGGPSPAVTSELG